MKRLCLWLVRMYPAPWRSRYEVEFAEMLHARPDARLSDATDMLLHCAGTWIRCLTTSPLRLAAHSAALVAVVGVLCALYGLQGEEALWRSATCFMLSSLLTVPFTAMVSMTTVLRSGSARLAIALMNAGLLVGALAVLLVSLVQAASLPPFPVANYASPLAMDNIDWQKMSFEISRAREFSLHWGRSTLFLSGIAAAAAWPLSGLLLLGGRAWRAIRQ